jgi:hypothetical protein
MESIGDSLSLNPHHKVTNVVVENGETIGVCQCTYNIEVCTNIIGRQRQQGVSCIQVIYSRFVRHASCAKYIILFLFLAFRILGCEKPPEPSMIKTMFPYSTTCYLKEDERPSEL